MISYGTTCVYFNAVMKQRLSFVLMNLHSANVVTTTYFAAKMRSLNAGG